MNKVIYRELKEYPNYRVGTDGSVWSRKQQGSKYIVKKDWHRLSPNVVGVGRYLQIGLCVFRCGKKVRIHRKVHQLILETFIGPRPSESHHACHVNGQSQDNRLENLEWGTVSENRIQAFKHGTVGAKLSPQKIRLARELRKSGVLGVDIARDFGVVPETLYKALRGVTWQWVK